MTNSGTATIGYVVSTRTASRIGASARVTRPMQLVCVVPGLGSVTRRSRQLQTAAPPGRDRAADGPWPRTLLTTDRGPVPVIRRTYLVPSSTALMTNSSTATTR